MRILYLEDNPLDADLVQRLIRKSGANIQVDIVENLAKFRQQLNGQTTYDMILSDLRLPDGNAFDLLNDLQSIPGAPGVVVITGQGDEEAAVAVLKAGAEDYVVKSTTVFSRLGTILENAIQRRKSEQARRYKRLRVLYLEHHIDDADLTCRQLATSAPYIFLEIVNSSEAALRLLQEKPGSSAYDVLLMDYQIPGLNGLEIIKELREVLQIDIPIVLVTGHGNQDVALQALRLGASDYLVKNTGYLYQLPFVLENAYHRHQFDVERKALTESESRYRRLAENAQDVIFRYNLQPEAGFEYISPALTRLTGYSPEAFYQDSEYWQKLIHPDDALSMISFFLPGGDINQSLRLRWITMDGRTIWVEHRTALVLDQQGNWTAVEGVVRDVTEQVLSEERYQRQVDRLSALRTIDITISASMSLPITLDVVVENTLRRLGVDAVDILLLDPGMRALKYATGSGFRSYSNDRSILPIGQGLAWRAVSERKTICVSNLGSGTDTGGFAEFMALEGFEVYYGTPLIAKGEINGVLEVFLREPFTPDQEWLDFLETLAGQASIAVDSAELFNGLQQSNLELRLAYDTTLEGWVRALDLRDQETEGHTLRVADLSLALAARYGFSDEELVHMRRGALLHDIGKIAVPDRILLKPGPLDPEEWEIMRRHPLHAYELVYPIAFLRPAIDIPYCHHEKWDGSGYPRGLSGRSIPLAARIFSVVDVWDAITSDRPYRKAWTQAEAREYILQQAGVQFEPEIVKAFLQMLSEA